MNKWILLELPVELLEEVFFMEASERFGKNDDLALRRLQLAIGKEVYQKVVKVLEEIKLT